MTRAERVVRLAERIRASGAVRVVFPLGSVIPVADVLRKLNDAPEYDLASLERGLELGVFAEDEADEADEARPTSTSLTARWER